MSVLATTGLIALADAAFLFAAGAREKKKNTEYIKSIPVRVSVNGIRGKSTATRLITSILKEAGYKTIGKTTGTAARMIVWNEKEERIIERKPYGVSVYEQLEVIREAANLGAEALVCECMAVDPMLQRAFTHKMFNPEGGGVTVIVNVVEDHLDQMGPTTEEIALAFGDCIPYNGYAVIPDCEFTDYFIKIAQERNSKYEIIDDSLIPQEFLNQFDYKLFEHNCAVALATARVLGLDDDIAFRGMLNANSDPGALRVHKLGHGAIFVNGFAANEPSSSLDIWEMVKEEGYDCSRPIIVMNCRPDRVDRTNQFVRDFFSEIENATLLVIGERTKPCVTAYQKGKFSNLEEFKCIEGKKIEPIMEWLKPKMENRVVFGVGNIHGIGMEFMDALFHAYDEENTDC